MGMVNLDSKRIVAEVMSSTEEVVPVWVDLPDYIDVTSLLAMRSRALDVSKVANKKLRIVCKTTNLDVEKYVTRLFAELDKIFVSVDWRP